ncbi:MAG: hypothetical protein F6K24_37040, partial [Okeania sp. SIO2D1]|nr:hypothetical protein [Okeania sp. SIO2D1]
MALCKDKHKLDSAQAIASLSEEAFVNAANLQDAEQARSIHRQAKQKTAGAMVFLANVIQFSAPRHGTTLFDSASVLREGLKSIPSYQDLFGSLDYLQCDPCQSIFGPAAYFVDLMRMVEEYITQTDEIYKLKTRRPDLEKIELTCNNTNDTVPFT